MFCMSVMLSSINVCDRDLFVDLNFAPGGKLF